MLNPGFVVIGAAKAGTTALYWYLAEHPQIFMSPVKETNFFAYEVDAAGNPLYGDPDHHRFPIRRERDYQALFADAGSGTVTGEASPIYLECPFSARRISESVPGARIICGLRNPVDRAYSDYLMYLRSRGHEFDPSRDLVAGASWAQPDSHWVTIGRYHEMLSRYFDHFPHEQIHIYLFDDLKRSPTAVVQDMYEFLGVDRDFVPDFDTPHNVGGLPRSRIFEAVLTSDRLRQAVEPLVPARAANWVRRLRTANMESAPPLPDELRRELTEHYRDEIKRTSELIGQDLAAWT